MEQMRGKIKCSCLRSRATGWGFQSVSHVWPLLWGPSQLIKHVFIGMPRVHLWFTKPLTATSMCSQAQGSLLNNRTSYDRAKSKIESVWRQHHMLLCSPMHTRYLLQNIVTLTWRLLPSWWICFIYELTPVTFMGHSSVVAQSRRPLKEGKCFKNGVQWSGMMIWY